MALSEIWRDGQDQNHQIQVSVVNGIWKVIEFKCFAYITHAKFIHLSDRTSLRNLHGSSTENGDSNSQYEIARQILENDAGDIQTNNLPYNLR